MKQSVHSVRPGALALALVICLTIPAAALFGRQKDIPRQAQGAPIAQNLEIQVYRGVPFTGELSAIDNEDDPFSFVIVNQGKKGTVRIGDDGLSFIYTPEEGKSGQDSFTYAAQDVNGNLSLPATVKVTIIRQKPAVMYSDMTSHQAATAAVTLAQEEIFTGTKLGEQFFFEPDRNVSRSEFLAMAMAAAGQKVPASVTMTGFCDDQSIPAWAKGYASIALKDGVIAGVSTAEGVAFDAQTPITVNEAATVLNRLLTVTDVDVGELYAQSPAWAVQAIANMESVSVLRVSAFGETGGSAQVTRAEAAQMLCAALTLIQNRTAR